MKRPFAMKPPYPTRPFKEPAPWDYWIIGAVYITASDLLDTHIWQWQGLLLIASCLSSAVLIRRLRTRCPDCARVLKRETQRIDTSDRSSPRQIYYACHQCHITWDPDFVEEE